MKIETVNIGTLLEPKMRLTVDGVIVGRGSAAELEPLRIELTESHEKACAIKEAFLRIA